MTDPAYAERVLHQHLERAGLSNLVGRTALELGPGDSAVSGLLARGLGAELTYLVDAGDFATRDMEVYRRAAEHQSLQGLPYVDVKRHNDFVNLLQASRAEYHVGGLSSLRKLPDECVDFIWSQAVLEHVRRNEFADCMSELYRILRPGGVSSHTVDLKDHLGAALNNLRFSEAFWEHESVATAGFYTNRLSMNEMLELMERAGFLTGISDVRRWDRLPTPRARMARQFRDRPQPELLVQGFDVVLRKPTRSSEGKPGAHVRARPSAKVDRGLSSARVRGVIACDLGPPGHQVAEGVTRPAPRPPAGRGRS